MSEFTEYFDESARIPVREDETVSGWSVGMVIFGICLTLPTLYTGAITAEQLGFIGTAKAVGLASLVLSIMSIPAAIVGAETRLSSYLIIEFVFGRRGSDFVNALLGLTLLGWFAVTAGFFGETLAIAFEEMFAVSPPTWLLTLISSVLILITTIFGFKAIDRLALFAVPLLILFLLYVSSLSLADSSWETVLSTEGSNPAYFSTAVSTVIGSLIVGVVLMPDLSRYARSVKDCVSASVLGNGVGNCFSMLMGVAPAIVTGLLDPMAYMIALGLVGSAFVILVFATWTTNSVNLYSTTLAVAIIKPKIPEWKLTVACGVIGTALAMIGITDYFIGFLEWLGVIVPPVASIYLTDYFVLKQKNYSLTLQDSLPDYDHAAIVAWVIGTAISAFTFVSEFSLSTIPTLDALVITAPIYLICRRLWPAKLQRSGVVN
ncbi:MAG TPA: permease [Gammaproteobacteria bacterium]|mgnify:FL=1|nr:permease [Gammaproteobacteria bacterium]HAU23569.1 permease [Gammaproteobacteria bacterium]HCI87273.1 permease [Gammaproteobacteria bacterium]